MAPRGKRGGAAGAGEVEEEAQAFHQLGVRGRKTGAFLKDNGERDEHGMQPIDDIFSSPQNSGSEDMEISSSGGPGPRTVLKNQRNIPNPHIDESSPTRKSFHQEEGTIVVATRGNSKPHAPPKPDATTPNNKPTTNGKQKSKTNGTSESSLRREEPEKESEEEQEEQEQEEEQEEELDDVVGAEDEIDLEEMVEASMQMIEAFRSDPVGPDPRTAEDEEEEVEEDDDEEQSIQRDSAAGSKKKPRGRQAKPTAPSPKATKAATKAAAKTSSRTTAKGKAKAPPPQPQPSSDPSLPEEPEELEEAPEEEVEEEEQESAKKRRGRPSKKNPPQPEKAQGAVGRKRRSMDGAGDDRTQTRDAEEENDVPRKKQKTGPAASKIESSKSKKGKGRPSKKAKSTEAATNHDSDDDAGETSFAALQRGPPMPKSRGLYSVRKDTITQTRSGRNSYRPVDYWRGEQVILEEEEQNDIGGKGGFIMSKVKEVLRVPMEESTARTGGSRGKARPKPKDLKPVAEEEPLEEWEREPGIVEGEIVLWEPEHEEHPPADDEPVQVTDERIAISGKAVQTSEIRDATFRFAKTLTMPFMGAGVVDLPPGGEKRPKNSRKMHMVFFVHSGKVMVTINEAQFRISAGGMWFVPRGNYYSITNDYENASRVFFCQACEISASMMDSTQMSMGAFQS